MLLNDVAIAFPYSADLTGPPTVKPFVACPKFIPIADKATLKGLLVTTLNILNCALAKSMCTLLKSSLRLITSTSA